MTASLDSVAWAVQVASCLVMTGVILVVQLIHYPSFALIDRVRFVEFHRQHSTAISWIAAPAMCAELVSALWLARNGQGWFAANAAAVLGLWLITFMVSVPAHHRLAAGFDEVAWRRLVRTNWLRTALWSLRGAGMLFVISLRA